MDSATEARKQRIITHMNKEHTRELAYYLRHFARVPAGQASRRPQMRDISLEGMLITTPGGGDHAIPFAPPLTSWADVKARIIEMSEDARKALGLSDVVVAAFVPPQGFGAVVFAAVVFYFGCAATLQWVVPGTQAWEAVDRVFPGGVAWYRWIVRTIFIPVLGIHVFECILFDKKLVHHGVERFSGLWWAWQVSCFFEGLTSFKRVDAVVASKRAEKEGKKGQ